MAMQRLFSKLRSFSVHSAQTLPSSLSSPSLHRSCPPLLHQPLPFASIDNRRIVRSLFSAHSPTQPSLAVTALRSSPFPFSMVQVRHVSSRERKKRRKPMTPVTSKLKKTKMKSYSSYKSRFRTMNDGTIRRWRAGKRHNAHSKSKISKRRLRVPALVHPAYATVMKKLNFCG
ncbi:DNA (cytosine-5)-methyltransferase CMT2-like [Pyrus ussuriensis x Pyrus communis]|uniref:DNA (Cytosine-5)-methyltransferase CMT2-like n=1 Tax=Pyrus ussuriensis x Pyrus communis TaxID=2448454 RepID=A0A5N5I163_9ROSA|nr:DNA (cytosine-5)-methyltransferase CMT2-like [Pyrus ussuriensis x Pyrus communis]